MLRIIRKEIGNKTEKKIPQSKSMGHPHPEVGVLFPAPKRM